MIEHDPLAFHQVFVVIQCAAALHDAEVRLHPDVHPLRDWHHLQCDDYATQVLDRAGGTHAAVTDKGDGLALPLEVRAAAVNVGFVRGILFSSPVADVAGRTDYLLKDKLGRTLCVLEAKRENLDSIKERAPAILEK